MSINIITDTVMIKLKRNCTPFVKNKSFINSKWLKVSRNQNYT